MDLFTTAATQAQARAASPAGKVEQALSEATDARCAGRLDEAVDKLQAALGWLGAANVRKELRVGVPRELGFSLLEQGDSVRAREALQLALEQADQDAALSDAVRGGLASLELMLGAPGRARQALEGRGVMRRVALMARARIELFEGQTLVAERTLQEADQAAGGSTATGVLLPPATLLRCFAAVWGARPEQARLLYDGVASREEPLWELTRVALLRALWVQSGDGRYLELARGAAEAVRFGAPVVGAPGFRAAVTAMHAATLAQTGEVALAVEAAHEAWAALGPVGSLSVPEWPRAAILCDLAMIYRDAGVAEGLAQVLEAWDPLAWQGWHERMELVAGPRVRGALAVETEQAIADPDERDLQALAVRLLEDPRAARLLALRSLGAAAQAFGVAWVGTDGAVLGRIGAQAPEGDEHNLERVKLTDGSNIVFYKAQQSALRALGRSSVEGLVRVVRVREAEARRIEAAEAAQATAEAARRLAEERLEQARRPGTDRGHGGRFPSVVGRSDALKAVLDRLGALGEGRGPVVIEGAPGSGRRHVAQAFFLAGSDDPTGSVRAPVLVGAWVEEEAQVAALERLEERGRGGMVIVAGAEALGEAGGSWLADRMAEGGAGAARWVVTLDARADGAMAAALRGAGALVRVPSLEARMEDFPLLIDTFAKEGGKRADEVSTATRAWLARRTWPGQLAELRATLVAAAVRAGDGVLQPEHFERAEGAAVRAVEDPLTLGLKEAVRGFQRELVERALAATAGHALRAADLLGVSRAQLDKLVRDLKLDPLPEAGGE